MTADDGGRSWVRLRALLVAVPVLALIAAIVYVLLDPTLERAVEDTGAQIVGAKVEVDAADVRLREGRFVLNRLQVANPEAPFTNLVEVREIVFDFRTEPLLEKKLVADTVVIAGVRFGTPRETSGELEERSPEAGRIWREVNAWADSVRLPSFTWEGIGGVVNVDAIDDDSLSTLALARGLIDRSDSTLAAWEARIRSLDPRPLLDSARVLVERVESLPSGPVGLVQAARILPSARGLVTRVRDLEAGIVDLDRSARQDVEALRAGVGSSPGLLQDDLAYGRRLLRLPSLEAPNISPALFRDPALAWLKPVLYWVNTAERYLPPGLDPDRLSGPERLRAPGTTRTFPGRATYPRFLLEYGSLDLEVGGTGFGAGQYTASVRGITSAPALYGRPIEIEARRTMAERGPAEVWLRASLAHGERPIRDSVDLRLVGIPLPSFDLGVIDARLNLGIGQATFTLSRVGSELDAGFRWVSEDLSWEAGPSRVDTAGATIGTERWAKAFLWRSLVGVNRLELDMALRGSIAEPSLVISSNLGDQVARSLRAEVGAEVQRAERQLRAEVDRRVQAAVVQARTELDELEARVAERVGPLASEVPRVREQLEEAIARLIARQIGQASSDSPDSRGLAKP
jgi:uncharacterized protein (TIGR03545 family)